MKYQDTSGTRVRNGPDRPPQTVIERRLYEAKIRGDVEGYVRVLAGTELFVELEQERVDASPDQLHYLMPRDPGQSERKTYYLRTQGDLPPRRREIVMYPLNLQKIVRENGGAKNLVIEVNPGSASGMRFPHRDRSRFERTPWDRRDWARVAEETPPPAHGDDQVLTDRTGPLQGELAHGLACGVHLAVHRRVIWNRFGDIDTGYHSCRKTLERDWGVTSAAQGLEQLQALLSYRNSPSHPEIALRCRRMLVERDGGGEVDQRTWREFAAEVGDRNDFPPRLRELVEEAIERIPVYEDRFRADGLLPPDGRVWSAAAYDYGRAVNFARWIVSARYFEPEDLLDTVLTVSKLSKEAYDSWEEYSAGYTLGRVLRFDDGEFGHFYESALTPHRLLAQDPESPWRTIPFRDETLT